MSFGSICCSICNLSSAVSDHFLNSKQSSWADSIISENSIMIGSFSHFWISTCSLRITPAPASTLGPHRLQQFIAAAQESCHLILPLFSFFRFVHHLFICVHLSSDLSQLYSCRSPLSYFFFRILIWFARLFRFRARLSAPESYRLNTCRSRSFWGPMLHFRRPFEPTTWHRSQLMTMRTQVLE